MKFPWKPPPEEIPDMLGLFSFQGQKTEAEKFFLKAIELDPTKGNCLYALWLVLLYFISPQLAHMGWNDINAKIMRFMNPHMASTLAFMKYSAMSCVVSPQLHICNNCSHFAL